MPFFLSPEHSLISTRECPVLYKASLQGCELCSLPGVGEAVLLQWGVGSPPYPVQDEGLGLETSPDGEACPSLALCSGLAESMSFPDGPLAPSAALGRCGRCGFSQRPGLPL